MGRGNFEDWYDSEQMPILLEDADWLMVRRLDIVQWDPEPHTHLILHYLNDERALVGEAIKRARATEWARRLAAETWFTPLPVTYHRRNKRFLKSG